MVEGGGKKNVVFPQELFCRWEGLRWVHGANVVNLQRKTLPIWFLTAQGRGWYGWRWIVLVINCWAPFNPIYGRTSCRRRAGQGLRRWDDSATSCIQLGKSGSSGMIGFSMVEGVQCKLLGCVFEPRCWRDWLLMRRTALLKVNFDAALWDDGILQESYCLLLRRIVSIEILLMLKEELRGRLFELCCLISKTSDFIWRVTPCLWIHELTKVSSPTVPSLLIEVCCEGRKITRLQNTIRATPPNFQQIKLDWI